MAFSKNELLEMIAECGGNTANVTDRTRKGLLRALSKTLAEQPESGGADVFKVQFTMGSTSSIVVPDKTIAEIVSAANSNKIVIGYVDSGEDASGEHQIINFQMAMHGSTIMFFSIVSTYVYVISGIGDTFYFQAISIGGQPTHEPVVFDLKYNSFSHKLLWDNGSFGNFINHVCNPSKVYGYDYLVNVKVVGYNNEFYGSYTPAHIQPLIDSENDTRWAVLDMFDFQPNNEPGHRIYAQSLTIKGSGQSEYTLDTHNFVDTTN